MRKVTKAQVLEAADRCAQRGEEYRMDADVSDVEGSDLVIDAFRVAIAEHGAWMAISSDYALASSILYAAALEGGPMPAGRDLVDDDICGPVMVRTAAARSVP